MLVNQKEQRQFSSVSAVDVVDGTGTPVMYMMANYDGKQLTFSENIQDYELYKANKKEVEADQAEFKKYVMKQVG